MIYIVKAHKCFHIDFDLAELLNWRVARCSSIVAKHCDKNLDASAIGVVRSRRKSRQGLPRPSESPIDWGDIIWPRHVAFKHDVSTSAVTRPEGRQIR